MSNYLTIKKSLKNKISSYLESELDNGLLNDIKAVITTPRSNMFEDVPIIWITETNTNKNPVWDKSLGEKGYTLNLLVIVICFDSENLFNSFEVSENLISVVSDVIYNAYKSDDSRLDSNKLPLFEIEEIDSFPDTPIEGAVKGVVAPSIKYQINFHDKACRILNNNN